MPWPLFEVPHDAPYETKAQPGAYWFIPIYGPGGEQEDYFLRELASDEYKRDWAYERAPITVCLPCGDWWLIDRKCNGSSSAGWTITGKPPELTARPSIGTSGYHGWLTDGVLSDDIEGRTYASPGAVVP